MAYITLSAVTIPTPAPYDSHDDQKQQENLAYVQLQICQALKDASFRIPDAQEVTRLVQELQTLNTNLTNIKTAIDGITLNVSPTDLTDITQAIKDLQYNDNVIDFGVFRIELRGKYKET